MVRTARLLKNGGFNVFYSKICKTMHKFVSEIQKRQFSWCFPKIVAKSTVSKLQKWHAPKNKSKLTRIFTQSNFFLHDRRSRWSRLFKGLPAAQSQTQSLSQISWPLSDWSTCTCGMISTRRDVSPGLSWRACKVSPQWSWRAWEVRAGMIGGWCEISQGTGD